MQHIATPTINIAASPSDDKGAKSGLLSMDSAENGAEFSQHMAKHGVGDMSDAEWSERQARFRDVQLRDVEPRPSVDMTAVKDRNPSQSAEASKAQADEDWLALVQEYVDRHKGEENVDGSQTKDENQILRDLGLASSEGDDVMALLKELGVDVETLQQQLSNLNVNGSAENLTDDELKPAQQALSQLLSGLGLDSKAVMERLKESGDMEKAQQALLVLMSAERDDERQAALSDLMRTLAGESSKDGEITFSVDEMDAKTQRIAQTLAAIKGESDAEDITLNARELRLIQSFVEERSVITGKSPHQDVTRMNIAPSAETLAKAANVNAGRESGIEDSLSQKAAMNNTLQEVRQYGNQGDKPDIMTDASKTTPKTTSSERTSNPPVIELLASMSEEKQVQVLKQLSNVVGTEGKVEASQFIATLKAGLEEFKAQLKQGREPGMDLKALVAQAAEGSVSDIVNTETARQSLTRVSQLLEAIHQTQITSSSGISANELSANVLNAEVRASGVSMDAAAGVKADTSPTSNASQLERAINIAKSDGAHQLAERVRMMINSGDMVADIRLDPPDLGGMQIRIQMNGDQASVSMNVQNSQARDLLEQALPKLREMLSERGIELGQSSVSQDQPGSNGEQDGSEDHGFGADGEQANANEESELATSQRNLRADAGGIDYFV